ncbi:hypothetical protein Aasi_0746 [Candidatus Amoebophilus asiaticus 5a2]|uniref:ABC transporter ATPase n=1 Tax=Amoebophilus asiaticus (strain 5a2) TaxID=452471 RepID=B3ESC7_AMOA5|nr:hypothetical protein [Candidatus Amoebophilus asiaticus]ACE06129.1 hypothetical protein Aasi_0746 [Candidatus Amoebophilus asiaticus 5a2]
MYIPFQQLSDQSSIWVYQADRGLSATDEQAILEQAKKFLENWSSHGRPLQASAAIKHGYFLILGIEKADFELTCCTTDSAIQFLHTLKSTMNINFLDRSKVVLRTDNAYLAVSVREAKEKLQDASLSSDTFTFDNTITQKQDLETRWLIPIKDAWFAK